MQLKLKVGEQTINNEDLLLGLIQHQILPQLAKEIIVDRAIVEIECTAQEEEQARQQFCQQLQIANEQQLEAWGKLHWMSPEQLRNRILRDVKINKFKEATWGYQIESDFLQQKSRLDRVVYSLIRTKETGLAQELYFRLEEEESSFAELAQKYSEGPEAQTGGLVGPVELGAIAPKLAQMLSTSQPKQLLPLTRIGEWFIISRLDKLIPVQLDKQTRQRLLEEKFQAWLQKELQQQVSVNSETEK
jgi:parvulin-like peptidyl-prolyl isomerase